MAEKNPAYPRYPKQIMGDNKTLLMDWDAYGMHNWLLDVSFQEEPGGTIPDHPATLRRWLRNPTDEVWDRVWPQLKVAWPIVGRGRRGNHGMMRTCERQRAYSESRSKAAKVRWNPNAHAHASADAYAVRETCDSTESENEVNRKPKELHYNFELEGFEPDLEFESLCQAYTRAERSPLAQNYYIDSIEWLVETRKMTRKMASTFIRNRAELYCKNEQKHKGLTNWLEAKIFANDKLFESYDAAAGAPKPIDFSRNPLFEMERQTRGK